MTILQINSVCGRGSTGRIAVDIANAAEAKGHKCFIAYGHGNTDFHRSYKIGNKAEHLFHNIIYSRLLGIQGYGSKKETLKFLKWIDSIRPDVIHLHNLHANYLNLPLLFNYIIDNKTPIVWTLHDCLNFTGKCSSFTSAQCNKWQTECSNCALYKSSGVPSLLFDRSNKIFKDKRNYYKLIHRMSVVAVSQWLKGEAEKSILKVSDSQNIRCIYNWIDHSVFCPPSEDVKTDFLKRHHLDNNTKYLVSVSQEWIKGSIRLDDAIRLSEKLPNGYGLILIGTIGKGVELPSSVVHIPYISTQKELAVAYSIAHAYVHFSIQDTFGLVIGEAMACGTIPITYNSTACAETPGGYGIVVEPRDIDAIVASLSLIEEKKQHIAEMIDFVRYNYDKAKNTAEYIDLYEKIITE